MPLPSQPTARGSRCHGVTARLLSINGASVGQKVRQNPDRPLTVALWCRVCYSDSVPPDRNQWTDHVLGWRFEFDLDPLRVRGEGPLQPGWRLGVVLLPHEGSLVVAEVRVFPDGDRRKVTTQRQALDTKVHLGMWSMDASALDPEHPTINTSTLRSIRLPEIIRAVQEKWASDMGREDRTAWEVLLGEKPSALASEFVRSIDLEHRGVGRPRRDKSSRRDVELAKIAAEYAEAVGNGSTTPVKDVALKLGLNRRYVRDAKFQAVEKGYLEGTQPRKAAGVLSKRAIEILETAAAKETS